MHILSRQMLIILTIKLFSAPLLSKYLTNLSIKGFFIGNHRLGKTSPVGRARRCLGAKSYLVEDSCWARQAPLEHQTRDLAAIFSNKWFRDSRLYPTTHIINMRYSSYNFFKKIFHYFYRIGLKILLDLCIGLSIPYQPSSMQPKS